MLFVSGSSPFLSIIPRVYDFFLSSYEIRSDVEIHATNLRDENALGFTEINGDEQLVQVCNTQDEKEFVTTILHELIHVVQNEQGMINETERESQAYNLEGVLYSNYCATC
jgi:Zn-dependent peptidase ImmA (M78 family)